MRIRSIHNGDASRSGPLSGSVGGGNHHGMIRRGSFVIDSPGASACFSTRPLRDLPLVMCSGFDTQNNIVEGIVVKGAAIAANESSDDSFSTMAASFTTLLSMVSLSGMISYVRTRWRHPRRKWRKRAHECHRGLLGAPGPEMHMHERVFNLTYF